jgi:hypothetical protein
LVQFEFGGGEPVMMLPDQFGHGSHSQRVQKPKRHRPAIGACELPNAGYRGVEATLSRARGLEERLPEPVEFVRATASGEQLNPDLRLKQGDRSAHRRLRHRETLGCFSEGADLSNRLEVPHLI